MRKKFPKLHSSMEPHERLNASIADLCKPLTREMFIECFERYGGSICGRCGKRITEEEGEYLITYDRKVDDPILGEVTLPPQVSQFKYCPRCHEVLKNGGPDLSVIE